MRNAAYVRECHCGNTNVAFQQAVAGLGKHDALWVRRNSEPAAITDLGKGRSHDDGLLKLIL